MKTLYYIDWLLANLLNPIPDINTRNYMFSHDSDTTPSTETSYKTYSKGIRKVPASLKYAISSHALANEQTVRILDTVKDYYAQNTYPR